MILSATVGLCACILAWVVTSQNSPLAGYFLHHTLIPNVWMALHALVYLAEVVIRPEIVPEAFVYYGAVVAQWILVGYVFSRFIYKKDEKTQSSLGSRREEDSTVE